MSRREDIARERERLRNESPQMSTDESLDSRPLPTFRVKVGAAQTEREVLVQQEHDKHRDNVDAELSRHRRAINHIDHVFRLRLGME